MPTLHGPMLEDSLALLDGKRRVFAIYADARADREQPARARGRWAEARDRRFREDPPTPLDDPCAPTEVGCSCRSQMQRAGPRPMAARYLVDPVKGADLGEAGDGIVLDSDDAHNPSCSYSPRWSCPLPQADSRLPVAVRAGERHR